MNKVYKFLKKWNPLITIPYFIVNILIFTLLFYLIYKYGTFVKNLVLAGIISLLCFANEKMIFKEKVFIILLMFVILSIIFQIFIFSLHIPYIGTIIACFSSIYGSFYLVNEYVTEKWEKKNKA